MAKRLTYNIDSVEELQKAFPEIVTDRHVVEKVIDKEKLYQVVKLHHSLERVIPGVTVTSPPPQQRDIEAVTNQATE